jgi:hypothetical protein
MFFASGQKMSKDITTNVMNEVAVTIIATTCKLTNPAPIEPSGAEGTAGRDSMRRHYPPPVGRITRRLAL